MGNIIGAVKGYVVIMVEGNHVERFVNLAMRRNIYVWDIVNLGSKKMRMKILAKDFKLLRDIARKTNCKVSIHRKIGMSFKVQKYKHRQAFLIGVIIFISILVYLNSYIWDIKITGNKQIKKAYILNVLKKSGLKEGMLKYRVQPKSVQDSFMLRANGIVWVIVKIKGTTAYVKVFEGINPPKLLDKQQPCNIIAKKDGVIQKIITREGKSEVSIGDSVLKNQLLVSGVVPNTGYDEGAVRYVHASAQVSAMTWYDKNIIVNYSQTKLRYSGNQKDKYELILFNKTIPLYFSKIKYNKYSKVKDVYKLKLGKNTVIPFGIIKNIYKEQKSISYKLSYSQVVKIAKRQLLKLTKEDISKNVNILDKRFKIKRLKYGIKASIVVECIEEIAQEKKIQVEKSKEEIIDKEQ